LCLYLPLLSLLNPKLANPNILLRYPNTHTSLLMPLLSLHLYPLRLLLLDITLLLPLLRLV